MKFTNKVLFYALIFLLSSLYPIPIKTDLIVHKAEKNDILHENKDNFEISFQKISSEKSLGKDGILKKEDGHNFGKVSKEVRKNEKLTTKNERDKNNHRFLQDEGNYIIVYYGSEANYYGYRSSEYVDTIITSIKIGELNKGANDNFDVSAGEYIKVYIDSSLTSLSSFFDGDSFSGKESNCGSIISIDLSHLTNDFEDLSYFFNSCEGFKVLNMSGLDLGYVDNSEDFFGGVTSIKYLDISNSQFSYRMKETIKQYFNINEDYPDGLIVCQSEQIITNARFEYKCCNYIPEVELCESSIHIDIYYKENTHYYNTFNNNYRDNVIYLATGDSIYSKEGDFEVISGNKLEIYFLSSVTTLESFFDIESDYLTANIESIDFSNFNVPGIISLKNIFNGCSSLKSVNFNNLNTDSVLNMDFMFCGCSSLTSIDLSGFNTQLVTTMESMFQDCSELTTLIYSDLITDSVTNMKSMFEGCSKLVSLSLTSFNTEKVTTMESMFFGCSGLETIDLSSFNTALVTNMKWMFENCSTLTSINLQNFNTASVTNMELMFYGCSGLETIDLSSFNTALVTSMRWMFRGCSTLTTIDLQNFNTQSVIDMELMFNGCSELETLDLSSWNTASATSMKSMFDGCSKLISIGLSSFKTEKVTNMESMFNGCRALTSLNLSHFNTHLVAYMKSMFNGCTNLKILDISGFDISHIATGTNIFANLNSIKYIALKDITLPSSQSIKNQVINSLNTANHFVVCQTENILTNNDLSYICCDFDPNINLCQNENYIKVFYAQEASYDRNFVSEKRNGISFINCNGETFTSNNQLTITANSEIEIHFYSNDINLNSFFDSNVDSNVETILSIDLSHLDSSKVTDMSRMFYGCSSLESINLDNFITEKVNDMNNMFNGCSTLESISLSTFTTSLVTNMDSMFYGCQSLKYLDLSNFDTSLVINMNSMFYGCQALEYLDISKFNMILTSTAENMFHNVINLKYLNLYHVQNSYESITRSDLNGINNLVVCQSENIITNEQAQKICCYYNILDQNCEAQNHIIVFFENEAQYTTDAGFLNEYRNDISFIIYEDHQLKRNANEQLIIKAKSQIEIYFTSELTSLENFFNSNFDANVENILSIDFMLPDSSSITKLNSLFYGCTLLESVDLSNIDSSSVIDMSSMFYGCSSLESITLSNFVTEKVKDMSNMFNECSKIKYLDLSNFDTSLVTNMNSMFSGCQALEFLDISKFNMIITSTAENMFHNVINLKYLNLYHIQNSYESITGSDLNSINNLVVCQSENIITNEQALKICCSYNYETGSCGSTNHITLYYKEDTNYVNGFTNNYRKEISFIIYNNSTIGGSNKLNIIARTKVEIHFNSILTNMEKFFSKEEDNNMLNIISIDFSQFNSSLVTNMDSLFLGCNSLDSINLEGFDTSNVENMNSMFAQCNSLKTLNLSNFVTSKVKFMNYMFYNCTSLNSLDISNFNLLSITSIEQMFDGIININFVNLYNTKDNGHFSDSFLNQYNFGNKQFYVCQKYNIITNPMSKNCCEFDNEGLCTNEDQEDEDNITESNTIVINETEQIENIYNSMVENIEETGYKIVKTPTCVFQYSTVEEQLNNKTEENKEVSSVDLGECEELLRKQEGLNDTEQFLMLKLDIKNSTTDAVYVQYEIFNPHDYSKVSLDICNNVTIKIQVPVLLEETKLSLIAHMEEYGYDIFNINDSFYNDICSTYTAQNGADMTLSSRKEIIYDSVKDMYLCQDGCEFQSFNINTSSANCHCQVQTEETVVDSSKLSFDKNEFYDGFYKTLYNSNFRVVKCIKLLFSLKGMKSNYGFYFMAVLTVTFAAFVVIHILKGHGKITNIIKIIITLKESKQIKDDNIEKIDMGKKEDDKKEDKKDDKKEEKIEEKDEDKKENKKEFEASKEIRVIARNALKRNSSKRFSKKSQMNKTDNLQAPYKKTNSKRNMTGNKAKIKSSEKIISNQDMNLAINTDDNIIKETSANPENAEKKNENKDKENQIIEKYQDLRDEELTDLDYEQAIILDKRTYWQLYLSLIKKDQLILFTFFRKDDYNLPQIKIILFIVSFAFFFTINGFFFTDESMNNIYEDNGAFNFIYQIPQILYSSIVTTIISMILQKLSISEEKILEMKKEKDLEKSKTIANKILKNLKLKLIIFIVFSSILMILFLYFISCFCAVYGNTQLILIEDTLISFSTSLIYPFGFKLLPGLFRIPALRAENKDKKCLYKISKIVNLI